MSGYVHPDARPLWHGGFAKCPDCGERRIAYTNHESVCTSCGLTLEEGRLDPGAEWRSFAEEPDTGNRVGSCTDSYALPGGRKIKLTTEIGPAASTAAAASASTATPGIQQGIQRVQRSINRTSTEQTLARDIELMNSRMERPGARLSESARRIAHEMYAEYRKGRTLKQLKEPVMAVCVWYAAREHGSVRAVKEICNAFVVQLSDFKNAKKKFLIAMKKEADADVEDDGPEEPMPLDDITRRSNLKFANSINGASGQTTDAMKRMIQTVCPDPARDRPLGVRCARLDAIARQHGLVGSRNPLFFGMAVVLMACQDLGVHEVTAETFVRLYDASQSTIARNLRMLRRVVETVEASEARQTREASAPSEGRNGDGDGGAVIGAVIPSAPSSVL